MTALRINLSNFSSVIREQREEWEDGFPINWQEIFPSYRAFLASEIKSKRHLWQPEAERTAEDLRRECSVAAMRAGEFGATEAQINEIVRLSTAKNDFRGLGYGLLSRKAASTIISTIKGE